MRYAMAVLVAAVFSGGTAQAQENPYVLKLDRTQYRLQVPATGEALASAASGSSAAQAGPSAPQRVTAASQDYDAFRKREQDYEQRITRLTQERDAWRVRAERLEADLAASRGPAAPFAYPLPPRP